jgi:uncharacterized protein
MELEYEKQDRSISTPLSRITVIDALRGFALLGVILTHMWQHYSIFSFQDMEQREALFPELDAAIQWLMQHVIMGKFINIFAFLFGLSFFIQMNRAAKKGVDFRRRFLWRMVILFVIGTVGTVFYSGDILSIYAVFGVFIVFLYRVKSWILITLVSLLLIGMPRILTTSYDRIVKVEQPKQTTENRPSVRPPASAMEKPSFINSAKQNLTRGLQGKINYQFGLFARGYITLALFILGLIVGRLRFFEEVYIRKKRNVILLAGCVPAIVVLDFVTGLFPEQPDIRMLMFSGGDVPPSALAVMGLNDIRSVLFSGALALSFIVLYGIKDIGRRLNVISPYGRMGLTNYVTQNVVGCLLFSIWAFGTIFGRWGTAALFVSGLALYVIQVIISKYWMKYYLYGPFEWFWRSATYLKLQPFRKNQKQHEDN